jgi:hypothetical protein
MGCRFFSRAAVAAEQVAAEQEASGAEEIRSPGGSLGTVQSGSLGMTGGYPSYSRGTRSLIAVRIS